MIVLPVKGTNERYAVKPSKIIALGLNYKSHIAESASVNVQGFSEEIPEEPILFAKTPNVLVAENEPIIIPRFLKGYSFDICRIDYEAELAFIVKERCRNVPVEEALRYVYGYTCMNDVSQRNIQMSDKSGWFRGKSLDTFGPIGPRIVLSEDIGDPQNLRIQCRLNGVLVQDSNTKHMIFPIAETVSFISKNFTLLPGDVISTGTPAGVGPMKHGDVVEVEIETIGVLRNPVVEE